MKVGLRTLLITLGLMTCNPVMAHHGSNAAYEMEKLVTLQGTVTEFVWRNPHCRLYFDAMQDGRTVHWGAETSSPGVLERAGWNKSTFQPGDRIKVTLHPSKAGILFGELQKVILPDGREFNRIGGE